MKIKLLLQISLLFLIISVTMPLNTNGQNNVYANNTLDSSIDIQHAYKITDNNNNNYAYISNLLNILNNSYVTVGFPQTGHAGDAINITIQGTGQVLGAALLNSITVRLYDSLGNNVATGTGGTTLKLSLLSNAGNIYSVRFLTNPTQNYTFKKVRVEFNNLLTVNLLNEFRIYNIFFQVPCPAILASSVYAYGTNTLLTGYVSNPSNAIDNNTNNYATLTVPLDLLSLLPPAYLDLQFPSVAKSGEYAGVTVGDGTGLISLSLLQHVELVTYNESNIAVDTFDNFTLADLKLLDGYNNRYTLMFKIPGNNQRIKRLRITLKGLVGVFEDIKVYNAFHYDIDRKPVTILASGNPNVCAGGSITLTAVDSMGGTNYVWSTGQTTQSITVNASGTYSVTVTDSVACSRSSLPLQINILPPLQPVITGDSVLCQGTGGVIHTAAAYSSYAWSTGSTAANLNVTSPGTYSVSVVDSNGCAGSDTINVKNGSLAVTPAITASTCINAANGSIATTVNGGSGNYSYLWSTGAASAGINNLMPGIYTAVVRDNGYNCSYNYAFTVTSANVLSIRSAVVNETDSNKHDGTINIDVIGGQGNYSYAWSNGATSASLSGLTAGIYMVTVTDVATGCSISDTIIVDVTGNNLSIAATTNANVGCNTANGSINLTVTGGSGNYSYLWNTGATAANLTGLVAGHYFVTVTDNTSHKTRSAEIVLSNTGMLNVSGTALATACNNATGSITLNVTNGSGAYSYLWSTGAATANITGLKAGVYIVTVTDNTRGCSVQKMFTIAGGGPQATITANNPTCTDNADGSINVNATGNNIAYEWSNGAHTQNITNLLPGTYGLKMTDTLTGCMSIYSATLVPKDQVNISANSVTNSACSAPYNGSVSLNVSGGTQPYTYSWSNGGNTSSATDMATGTYTATVTDANGCSNTIIIFVNIDSTILPMPVAQTVQDVKCRQLFNGSVDVNVTGGTPPYAYAWSNGSTGQDISDLTAGTYTLVVTDNNHCQNGITATINDRSVDLSVGSTVSAKCVPVNSGNIYVDVQNGFAPFMYQWSNTATTKDLLNVAPDEYTLIITDSIGCKDTLTADVTKTPDPTVQTSITGIKCHGDANGAIAATAGAGSGNYTYNWNTGATTQVLNNISSGTYILTVQDNSTGCTVSDTVMLDEPAQLTLNAAAITNTSCAAADGTVDLLAAGGTTPYTYSMQGSAIPVHVTGLGIGQYTISVTDGNNCIATNSFTISRSADCDVDIVVHDVITPNNDGVNDLLVIEGVYNYPNCVLQVFDKWGDMVYEKKGYNNDWGGLDKKGQHLAAGTYYYLLKLNANNIFGGKNEFTGFIMIQR